MATNNIIQLPPDALAGNASWAARFPGVNAAQRVQHNEDKIAYARALQQQQADHMAQLANSDKDTASIVRGQQEIALKQKIHQDNLAHQALMDSYDIPLKYAREQEMKAKELKDTATQTEAYQKKTAEHNDTAGFTSALTKARHDGMKDGTPGFHSAVIAAHEQFPAADNKFTAPYVTAAINSFRPLSPEQQAVQDRHKAATSQAAQLLALNKELSARGVPLPVSALFNNAAGAGVGGTYDPENGFTRDSQKQTHIQIPTINAQTGQQVPVVLGMPQFNKLKEDFLQRYNAIINPQRTAATDPAAQGVGTPNVSATLPAATVPASGSTLPSTQQPAAAATPAATPTPGAPTITNVTPQATPYPSPNDAAISHLKSNPDLANDFNKMFGDGTSDKYLNGQ